MTTGLYSHRPCGQDFKISDNAFAFENVFVFDNADDAFAFDNALAFGIDHAFM